MQLAEQSDSTRKSKMSESAPQKELLFNVAESAKILRELVQKILQTNPKGEDTVLIGIQTGGVALAQCLANVLSKEWGRVVEVGHLDITMHRDDIGQRIAPIVHPTYIPFDITNKRVLLIDDVLYSGRTSRAALDALIDLGRPKKIELAVFIDRGHRELPIQPDYVGRVVDISPEKRIEVEADIATNWIQVYLVKSENLLPQE